MQPGMRAPTAFELFLQRRQQAAVEPVGCSEPLRVGPVSHHEESKPVPILHLSRDVPRPGVAPPDPLPPPVLSAPPRQLPPASLRASQCRPYGSSPDQPQQQQQNNLRRSAPELSPQVVALPSPRQTTAAAAAADSPAAGQAGAPATTAVYGELASAAASLASVAHKLARGSVVDRSVAASYETLAQAAADLAASACMIRPLTSSARSGVGSISKAPPRAPEPRSKPLPRAVDPMASAAAAIAAEANAAAAWAAQQGYPGHPSPAGPPGPPGPPAPAARPGTGSSAVRARVNAPRFPGYNPLIHLMESGLPRPGTGSAHRPVTSSPITHQFLESLALGACGGGNGNSTAGGTPQTRNRRRSSQGPQLRGAHHSDMDGAGAPLHPSELSRLPVLSLGGDGAAQQFSNGAAGRDVWSSERLQLEHGGGARQQANGYTRRWGDPAAADAQLVDPHAFLSPYADVRPAEWPLVDPITMNDMEQDELDMRYNKVLAALRERLHARGPSRLAAAFRDADRDGLGVVSRRDFLSVLQGMNLGMPGLVDDKVVDLMLASVDDSGRAAIATAAAPNQRPLPRVAYSDFVNALRFGNLPWRGYNRKLRHRMGGDPDQPIGPPAMAGSSPYGMAYGGARGAAAGGGHGTASGNEAPPPAGAGAGVAGGPLTSKLGDLRLAFMLVDHNGDGVVEWGEFREALRRVGEQHRLPMSDNEVLQIYQEADPTFSAGIDYEAFMAMYAAGAGGIGGTKYAADGARGPGGAAGAVALRYSHPSRPMPYSWSSQWRPQELQRAAQGQGQQQLQNQYPHQYQLQNQYQQGEPPYSEPPPGEGAAGGGGQRGTSGAPRPGGGAAGGPGAGWGPSRPEALRGPHAGATAVLKRLGSAGGGGRAVARA